MLGRYLAQVPFDIFACQCQKLPMRYTHLKKAHNKTHSGYLSRLANVKSIKTISNSPSPLFGCKFRAP